MTSENDIINFETVNFNPLESNQILLDNLNDQGIHLLDENLKNINTCYFLPEEVSPFLKDCTPESFSIIHINIRSINKTF